MGKKSTRASLAGASKAAAGAIGPAPENTARAPAAKTQPASGPTSVSGSASASTSAAPPAPALQVIVLVSGFLFFFVLFSLCLLFYYALNACGSAPRSLFMQRLEVPSLNVHNPRARADRLLLNGPFRDTCAESVSLAAKAGRWDPDRDVQAPKLRAGPEVRTQHPMYGANARIPRRFLSFFLVLFRLLSLKHPARATWETAVFMR